MRFFLMPLSIFMSAQLISCMFSVRHIEPARYSVRLLYSDERLNVAAFSGQSLLVLPVLTKNGADTTKFPSPNTLSRLFQRNHGAMQFIYPEAFEKKYQSTAVNHDFASLDRFYRSFFNGEIIKVQTSDSIWNAIDAAYLLCVRVKYAATIRAFDGNTVKRLVLGVELWKVDVSEAVWRAQVIGSDKRIGASDAEFVMGALKEIFSALPGGMPGENEKDW
jgi:hypothetical protein